MNVIYCYIRLNDILLNVWIMVKIVNKRNLLGSDKYFTARSFCVRLWTAREAASRFYGVLQETASLLLYLISLGRCFLAGALRTSQFLFSTRKNLLSRLGRISAGVTPVTPYVSMECEGIY